MRYILPFFVLLFSYCRNENTEKELTVTVEKIALRASPGIKSTEIATLKKDEKLLDLGEVSHFESEISFGNEALRTPWLKVQAGKQQGWIFAGAVKPAGKMAEWLLQKRLDCYFGHAFASRLNTCKESLTDVTSDTEFATGFRSVCAMRDTMLYLLERRSEPNGRPEYAWLADVLPGFIHQRAYAGGPPFLYVDYRFWLRKAVETTGNVDDSFLETCLMVFPHDSIESAFPVWKFPISELESASQLGTGAHLKVLQQIDKTLAQSRLFEPELMQCKDALLEDIHDKYIRYWQPETLILQELDAIIAHPPTCLTASESSGLQHRRVMFEEPEKNGIRVNLRSGE